MQKLFILAKNTIFVGVLLTYIPIMVALYFFRDRIENEGLLLIRLTFIMLGLVVLYLVIKIIKKLIRHDEENPGMNLRNLIDLSLFNGVTNKQILVAFGVIVCILFLSLVPSPWNIFLMLGGFYAMFTLLIRLA